MRIQHNIAALNSHRNLTNNNSSVSKNLEKLSSGYRINRAGDDAAGLAVSEKMRAQITGLQTAQKNAEDGISLVQTAEGALTEVHSMLNRMVELATQSANGTYENTNRDEMQKEIVALRDEIDRISKTSNFNNQKLFVGGADDGADGGADGTTTVTVTPPNSYDITPSGNNGTDASQYDLDFAGIAFDNDGTVTVTLGDVSVDVDVTKDMFADDFATAFATAFNAQNVTDSTAGAFEATATSSSVSIKAANTAAETDKPFGAGLSEFSVTAKAEPAANADDDEDVADGEALNIILHVGETSSKDNGIEIKIEAMSSASLGVNDLDISEQDDARTSIDTITKAIDKVSSIRSDLGSLQNRLEHTINNLGVQTENITAAEARIRDVDMAKEMMAYTKNNILVQASQAMLAQANQQPQGVLQLLQ